jgi:hypothetical protein
MTADDEVIATARWIRSSVRNIDHNHRTISYQKLQTILNRFGYDIVNPKSNHVDLVRNAPVRKWLGFGPLRMEQQRIRRIGFQSWKGEVPRGVMKEVREAAGLTFEKGIDSKVFYDFDHPLEYLVGRYELPLRNLADR